MKPRFLFLFICLGLFCSCTGDPKAERDKFFKKAEKYLGEGKYDEAVIEYRNALQKDKGHIPSYLALAKTFQRMGSHQNAIGLYQEVVKLDDKNTEARIQIGNYMLVSAARNPDLLKKAQEEAEAVLKIEPSNVPALMLLSGAYGSQKNFDKAIENLEKALALDANNLGAALSLGSAQMAQNKLEEAEITFKKALQKHPKSIQAHLTMAKWCSVAKRPSETEEYLKKAFQLDPGDAAALNSLASLYYFQKRLDDAENVYREAIAKKSDSREPRWGLVGFYLRQGLTDKGIAALQDMLKILPGDRPAQLALAEAYLSQKNESKAEEIIRSLIAKKKDDAEAHYLMGKLLLTRKQQDKAFEEFEAAIKANKLFVPAKMEKANLLLGQGNLEGAQHILEEILQQDRGNITAKGALAKVLALRSRSQDALQQAQEVLAAAPKNENALMAKAEALRLLGKKEEAKKDFLSLAEQHPNNAFYWHRVGVLEVDNKKPAAALQHFRKALEVQPSFALAANDLVYILFQMKKGDEALAEMNRWAQSGGPADEVHRFRGQIYLAKGDQKSAESELRKAIETNSRNIQAYLQLAQLKMSQNKLPEAISEVDRLISGNNKYTPAYLLKAYYLEAAKNTPAAIAGYRKVLELESENPAASNNLAWLLVQNNGNLEEALALARTARKKRPEEPEFADTLGWIYCRMKNYTLAIDQLLFSVNNRRKPSAESYYRLGLAYQGKGDLILAKQSMGKALEINPHFPEAAEARKVMERQNP